MATGNDYFKVAAYVGTKWVGAESAATDQWLRLYPAVKAQSEPPSSKPGVIAHLASQAHLR